MSRYTLIDAGPIVAYYSKDDVWHLKVESFFSNFDGQFITTEPIITESMWLLSADARVQNELISDVVKELYKVEHLTVQDYARIAELNLRYHDLPADFADLTLLVVAERLHIADIASLDSDFDIYRRYRKARFNRIFP